MGKLTDVRVRKTAQTGLHNDGYGLYLKVTDGDARSWIFRFKIGGRTRDMGLGPYPEISLADAREKAADARKLTRQGIDPIEARRADGGAAKGMTFDKAAAAYIQAHKAGWRGARTAHRWQSELERYAYPAFGKRDVATVTVDDVLRILAPIWTTKNETASKVRERIEAVLDWAAAKGYRSGVNPAMWRGNLKHLLPARAKVHTVRHHPALPWQELPAFMADLRGRDALAARALETTILTACRTSEVLNADRSELNGDLWVIPAERMKARKEHRVPLSTQAFTIISSLPCIAGNSYVFPGHRDGRSLSGMAMEMLLRRMGRSDITVHGFRSTFRDWAAEATDFPREISELCLAHEVGNEVERAYRRSDLLLKRRGLMQKWADYCYQK